MVVVAFDRRRPDLRGMAVGAFPGISQPLPFGEKEFGWRVALSFVRRCASPEASAGTQ